MNTAWKIVTVIAVIAMVVLVVKFIGREDSSGKVTIKMFFVKEDSIEKVVYGTGILKSSERAAIVSEIKGTLDKICVNEGDDVKKDDTLAEIGNTEIDNEIKVYRGTVEKLKKEFDEISKPIEEQTAVMSAKLAWDQANSDYESRKEELEDEEDRIEREIPKYSEDELQKLREEVESLKIKLELAGRKYEESKPTETDIRKAEGEYQKADEELSKLEKAAESRTVVTPIDGTVLKVFIDKETLRIESDKEYDIGTSLFLVADLSSVVVEGTVFESDIDKLEVGQPVKVFLSQQSKVWNRATLKKIPLTPSADSGKFDIRINFNQPPQNVKEGIRVDFQIVIDKRDKVLVVPIEYVRRDKGRTYVTVREEDGDREREVKLGISDDHFYHVLEGLEKGEKVIHKIKSAK